MIKLQLRTISSNEKVGRPDRRQSTLGTSAVISSSTSLQIPVHTRAWFTKLLKTRVWDERGNCATPCYAVSSWTTWLSQDDLFWSASCTRAQNFEPHLDSKHVAHLSCGKRLTTSKCWVSMWQRTPRRWFHLHTGEVLMDQTCKNTTDGQEKTVGGKSPLQKHEKSRNWQMNKITGLQHTKSETQLLLVCGDSTLYTPPEFTVTLERK